MKNRTQYGDEHVTFWPLYSAGKVGMVYMLVTAVMFLIPCVWGLCDSAAEPFPWHSLLLLLVGGLVTFLILRYIRRVMYQKIVISHGGIEITNAVTKRDERYLWGAIESIGFQRDGWFGRQALLVRLKESPRKKNSESGYDVAISVDGLDKNKLLEFIPRDLYCNDPKLVWFL